MVACVWVGGAEKLSSYAMLVMSWKVPGPAAVGVSETPVFEVARDCSLAGRAGAESANVLQIIGGLPETTMNHEEEREGSLTLRVP